MSLLPALSSVLVLLYLQLCLFMKRNSKILFSPRTTEIPFTSARALVKECATQQGKEIVYSRDVRPTCPTYINAQHRCRAPLLNESLPQLDLVASWEGETSKGQKVTLVTQLNLERWYWAVLQNMWARR